MGPTKILVADDNQLIRSIVRRIIETQDLVVCVEAVNGSQAVDLAEKHRPDLIIMDLSMPDMNGLDAAWKLKGAMPKVPIILFSDYSSAIGVPVSQTPFDRIVEKPNLSLLVQQIQAALPRPRSALAPEGSART